jgi:hypothetical protein
MMGANHQKQATTSSVLIPTTSQHAIGSGSGLSSCINQTGDATGNSSFLKEMAKQLKMA